MKNTVILTFIYEFTLIVIELIKMDPKTVQILTQQIKVYINLKLINE